MEPEFLHILYRVLAVGTLLVGGGFTALYFAFRAFERPTGQRGFLWLCAISFVIMIVCAVLWRLSYGAE